MLALVIDVLLSNDGRRNRHRRAENCQKEKPCLGRGSRPGNAGGLAEFERHLILARTAEGRERAQVRGVKFGRKPALTKHQQIEALARREAGEALTEIARTYNVSHSTISRLALR